MNNIVKPLPHQRCGAGFTILFVSDTIHKQYLRLGIEVSCNRTAGAIDSGIFKLMKQLRKGDILYIKSDDRKERNYDEIIEQWLLITKGKQTDIVKLGMPLLDARAEEADLARRFIFEIVLLINSYMTEKCH